MMFGTTFGGFDYIRQIVHLNAGDTLSGFAAYVSGDNSGIDPLYAKVRILNAVSTSVAEIANPWSFSGSSADSGWQPWSWTAPQTDFYTLSLELNTGEIATDVYAFFDANAVSPAVVSVPIPGSLMLLGSGLAGLGLLRRKWGLKV